MLISEKDELPKKHELVLIFSENGHTLGTYGKGPYHPESPVLWHDTESSEIYGEIFWMPLPPRSAKGFDRRRRKK